MYIYFTEREKRERGRERGVNVHAVDSGKTKHVILCVCVFVHDCMIACVCVVQGP